MLLCASSSGSVDEFVGRRTQIAEVSAKSGREPAVDPYRRGRGRKDTSGDRSRRRRRRRRFPTAFGMPTLPRSRIRTWCRSPSPVLSGCRTSRADRSPKPCCASSAIATNAAALDNCEHLLEASASLVNALLAHCAEGHGICDESRTPHGRRRGKLAGAVADS